MAVPADEQKQKCQNRDVTMLYDRLLEGVTNGPH